MAVGDLILGGKCCHCGVPGRQLCRHCARLIAPDPVVLNVAGVPVVSAARYRGPLRSLILAAKRTGSRASVSDLSRLLHPVLVEVLGSADSTRVTIVAVPSGPRTRFTVGDDLTVALLNAALRELGLSRVTVTSPLRAAPLHRQQKLRTRKQRARVTFHLVGRTVLGEQVIVADDVLTTGASLAAAVATLRSAGLVVRSGLVVARAGEGSSVGYRSGSSVSHGTHLGPWLRR